MFLFLPSHPLAHVKFCTAVASWLQAEGHRARLTSHSGFPWTTLQRTMLWVFQLHHIWKICSSSCADRDAGVLDWLDVFWFVAKGVHSPNVHVQHQCRAWSSTPEPLLCETQGTAWRPFLVYSAYCWLGDTIAICWLQQDQWSASASELPTSWFKHSFGSKSSFCLPSQHHPSWSCTRLVVWLPHIVWISCTIAGRYLLALPSWLACYCTTSQHVPYHHSC